MNWYFVLRKEKKKGYWNLSEFQDRNKVLLVRFMKTHAVLILKMSMYSDQNSEILTKKKSWKEQV